MLYLHGQTLAAHSCDVTVGINTDSYAGGSATDLVTALAALVAWLEGAGRPWFGAATWSAAWVRDSATGGAAIELTCSATFEVTNISVANPLGLYAAGAPALTMTGTAAQGTWWPKSDVAIHDHHQEFGEGEACGNGAVRPGVPGTALYRPRVTAIGTAVDAGRISYLTTVASSPRQVKIYHHVAAAWRTYALGDIERREATTTLYAFSLKVLGAA